MKGKRIHGLIKCVLNPIKNTSQCPEMRASLIGFKKYYFEESPNVFCLKIQKGAYKSSFSLIVLQEQKFYRYKIAIQQLLLNADLQRRRTFYHFFFHWVWT